MAHRPVWRCLMAVSCKDKCTVRTWEKPETCIHPRYNMVAVWERYEGRQGQRHLD